MLHLMQDTQLADAYMQQPFPLLTRDEYVAIVVDQLERLRPEIIIQRLTGDGAGEALIAPEWTKKKTIVLNEIDKRMATSIHGRKAGVQWPITSILSITVDSGSL
ncbi:MAG: hypothetical protein ACLSA6_14775 [Holdemania massiliensis]